MKFPSFLLFYATWTHHFLATFIPTIHSDSLFSRIRGVRLLHFSSICSHHTFSVMDSTSPESKQPSLLVLCDTSDDGRYYFFADSLNGLATAKDKLRAIVAGWTQAQFKINGTYLDSLWIDRVYPGIELEKGETDCCHM